MSSSFKNTFRSLKGYNYRLWAYGAIVSNIGTWMQRTAQAWLVLTELTDHNATALGIVAGLQYAPLLILLPLTGSAADHLDRRKLLLATQAAMGILAFGLGVLTLAGLVQLWHVYLFAFALGCAAAFDAPARQTFVSELVGDTDLSNAVALNSTSFNAARMIGPAIAGVLIAEAGTGYVFLVNGVSFIAVLCSLGFLRLDELHLRKRATHLRGSFTEGLRYVWHSPDIMSVLVMFCLVGTLVANFPIFISTMSVTVFHTGARQYGVLASMMAVGSVAGALLVASRATSRIGDLILGALVFGIGFLLAALAPDYWLFGGALVMIGLSAQIFTTAASSIVQLATLPAMRGRVMAILLSIGLGGTPLGAPFIGWTADRFGPRWALCLGAASGLGAVAAGVVYLFRYRRLRFGIKAGRFRFSIDPEAPVAL